MKPIETAAEAGAYVMDIMPYFVLSLIFIFGCAYLYMSWRIRKLQKKKGGK